MTFNTNITILGIVSWLLLSSAVSGSITIIAIFESNITMDYLDSVSLDIGVSAQKEYKTQTTMKIGDVVAIIERLGMSNRVEAIGRLLVSTSSISWNPITLIGVNDSFFYSFDDSFTIQTSSSLDPYSCIVDLEYLLEQGLHIGDNITLTLFGTNENEKSISKEFRIIGTYDSTFLDAEKKINPYDDWIEPRIITSYNGVRARYNDSYFGESNGVNVDILIRIRRDLLIGKDVDHILGFIQETQSEIDQLLLPYFFVYLSGLEDAISSLEGWRNAAYGLFGVVFLPGVISSFLLTISYLSFHKVNSSKRFVEWRGASKKQRALWECTPFIFCGVTGILISIVIDVVLIYALLNTRSLNYILNIASTASLPASFLLLVPLLVITGSYFLWDEIKKKPTIRFANWHKMFFSTVFILLLVYSGVSVSILSQSFWSNLGYSATYIVTYQLILSLVVFLVLGISGFAVVGRNMYSSIMHYIGFRKQNILFRIIVRRLSRNGIRFILSLFFIILVTASIGYGQIISQTSHRHIHDTIWFSNGADLRVTSDSDPDSILQVLDNSNSISSMSKVDIYQAYFLSQGEMVHTLLFGLSESWWDTVFLRDDFFIGQSQQNARDAFLKSNFSAITNFGKVIGFDSTGPLVDNSVQLFLTENSSDYISLNVVDRLAFFDIESMSFSQSFLPGHPRFSGNFILVRDMVFESFNISASSFEVYASFKEDITPREMEAIEEALPAKSKIQYASELLDESFLNKSFEAMIDLVDIAAVLGFLALIISCPILVSTQLESTRIDYAILKTYGYETTKSKVGYGLATILEISLGMFFGMILSIFFALSIGTWPLQALVIVSDINWNRIPESLVFPWDTLLLTLGGLLVLWLSISEIILMKLLNRTLVSLLPDE